MRTKANKTDAVKRSKSCKERRVSLGDHYAWSLFYMYFLNYRLVASGGDRHAAGKCPVSAKGNRKKKLVVSSDIAVQRGVVVGGLNKKSTAKT